MLPRPLYFWPFIHTLCFIAARLATYSLDVFIIVPPDLILYFLSLHLPSASRAVQELPRLPL